MVDEALKRLSEQQIIELDEQHKASMINNLLVVLTWDQNTQPVNNPPLT
jgi:hypothetical protein